MRIGVELYVCYIKYVVYVKYIAVQYKTHTYNKNGHYFFLDE